MYQAAYQTVYQTVCLLSLVPNQRALPRHPNRAAASPSLLHRAAYRAALQAVRRAASSVHLAPNQALYLLCLALSRRVLPLRLRRVPSPLSLSLATSRLALSRHPNRAAANLPLVP